MSITTAMKVLVNRIGQIVNALNRWVTYQRGVRVLCELDDRTLRDIGIERHQIRTVVHERVRRHHTARTHELSRATSFAPKRASTDLELKHARHSAMGTATWKAAS